MTLLPIVDWRCLDLVELIVDHVVDWRCYIVDQADVGLMTWGDVGWRWPGASDSRTHTSSWFDCRFWSCLCRLVLSICPHPTSRSTRWYRVLSIVDWFQLSIYIDSVDCRVDWRSRRLTLLRVVELSTSMVCRLIVDVDVVDLDVDVDGGWRSSWSLLINVDVDVELACRRYLGRRWFCRLIIDTWFYTGSSIPSCRSICLHQTLLPVVTLTLTLVTPTYIVLPTSHRTFSSHRIYLFHRYLHHHYINSTSLP